MELYMDKVAAIIDLHERGFTEDFEVVGKRLLWVQRQLFFKPKDFTSVEAYSFIESDGRELLVVGASLLSHFADGILIWQSVNAFDWRPALINNKFNELLNKVPGSGSPVSRSGFCKVQLQ